MAVVATQEPPAQPGRHVAKKQQEQPRIECKISRPVRYGLYMQEFNRTGMEPPELFDMKVVRTNNNPVLFAILSNLGAPPGCAYNVNGIWYQFHIAGLWPSAIRVAQVVVDVPAMAPRTIRYVDITFSAFS